MARFRPKEEYQPGPSAEETASLLDQLAKIEELGEEVITDRHQVGI